MTPSDLHPKHIKSFVLRQGHLSSAQQRAIDKGMPRWGVHYHPEPIDWISLFKRDAPKFLEIGFGMGTATATIAEAHPEHDYLGIEVHSPGVGNMLKLIEAQKLSNIRLIQYDAVSVLENMLEDNQLDGAHIFFPDPWPKKRHHKRRLIQGPFMALLSRKIKPGGYIHIATDWEEYANQILEVLQEEPLLFNSSADFAPRPPHRPITKFEARGLRLGHGVWDILFYRRSITL